MGRYYSGDIEGKFWFGVQSSEAATRFGVEPTQREVEYCFDISDLPEVKKQIAIIEGALGEDKAKLDEFFDKNTGYNDEMLVDAGFKKERIRFLLMEYADLCLGKEIAKCIEEEDQCCFTAEL